MEPPLLRLAGITKRFGDLVANEDVELSVDRGEVVAMLGENGAGKSTLMKVIYGLLRPDSGSVELDGRPVEFDSPRAAMRHGIGMVTQEFSLVDTMTVAENVTLSAIGWGPVDGSGIRQRVLAAMDRIGVYLDPDRVVGELSIGERQRVEIIKALYHDCRVLILDEPTAVLTPQDIRTLFATVTRLRESGLGVLFVSHKLKEVAEISDRVVVLRRGRLVGSRITGQVGPGELAALMMGGQTTAVGGEVKVAAGAGVDPLVAASETETVTSTGPPALQIRELTVERGGITVLDGLTMQVAGGEVLGLAGISGNGQTELVQALCGVRTVTAGSVTVAGTEVTHAEVPERLRAGLGRLTEDRRGSVFPQLSVEQNLVLEDLHHYTKRGLLDRKAVRAHAEAMIERFEIRAEPGTAVGSLSGGNIQKVLLARTLHRRPQFLVAAQPTRGLDIGTYAYVHRQVAELRERGAGVLLISEDLDELRILSDRIAVILRGRIVGDLPVAEATNERLGELMTGGRA